MHKKKYFFGQINNNRKQAKYVLSHIIIFHLKFFKRQKSLSYTSLTNANLTHKPQNRTKLNNLDQN